MVLIGIAENKTSFRRHLAENKSSYRRHFPKPEDFAKAIYMLDIGQNDLGDFISKGGKEDSQAFILNIVEYFSKQVQVSDSLY